jgi:5S rRNA maturation endonuclease (ribonuclease M5)
MNRPNGYIDVDRLQAETTLEQAAAKCGISLDVKGSGSEVRIDCPLGCAGDHCGRKEIAVKTDNPQKIWQCHAYECGARGNLLSLMHGFLTQSKPTDGKLKGDEFQRVKRVLASSGEAVKPTSALPSCKPSASPLPPKNTALIDSDDPRVRELHNIDEKLVREIATMNPAASAYIRRHPCLSLESMTKWRCGYLPNDGGGDKRGWSLRGNMIYPVLSESGKVLSWVGRNVHFEEEERKFQQLSPTERTGKDAPAKHRFPKGFHRGVELYGQQASRLGEPGYREFIEKNGLIIVEGFNDVIGLDNIGVPALGIMSNRMTEAQGEKIMRFAKQLNVGRINLMLDCDETGTEGTKEALWYFAEHRMEVRLVWSPKMHDGQFAGKQPESLSMSDVSVLMCGQKFTMQSSGIVD